MVTQGQQPTSWKEKAIQKAEGISDAWDVVKEYLGRAAEWVLFACMLENIIQMLPGINLPEMLTNAVMGTQVIMLDIGGFALASMAERAREQGHEEAADKAATTVKFLIGLMILTLLLVAVGNLFPAYKSYTDMAEKCLKARYSRRRARLVTCTSLKRFAKTIRIYYIIYLLQEKRKES
jgi:hypothetical protein